jgi:hypothetical protein
MYSAWVFLFSFPSTISTPRIGVLIGVFMCIRSYAFRLCNVQCSSVAHLGQTAMTYLSSPFVILFMSQHSLALQYALSLCFCE